MVRPTLTCCAMLAGATVACGCATLPDAPAERALYTDLRQVVETRERVGWQIDHYEVESALPAALVSVCQSEEETRIGLEDFFDRRIEELGGSAEEVYAETGDLSDVEEQLTLERMHLLLRRADAEASDKCPFYLSPDPDFAGVQADTDRFVLLGESLGGPSLVFGGGLVRFGGGGSLRLLLGYGVSDRVTMFTGLEGGAAGLISGIGTEEASFAARPVGGAPLLLRIHDDTWVYDIEAAVISQYHQETIATPGARGSFGVGLRSVRIGGFMPIAVGFVGYEMLPAFRDLPTTHAIRIGTRVGIDYDP